MKRIYIAKDPITANLLKARLEEASINAIVQDERTQTLHGEVPFVYPSVWVENGDEAEARKIALQLEHPQQGESWSCPVCGEVLDPSFADCWKCSEKPVEDSPAEVPLTTGRSDKKLTSVVGIVALLFLLGVGFGVYKAYNYQKYTEHFEAGYTHHMANRLDAAIKEYDLALQSEPGRTDVLMNRGSAWFAKGDYSRAIKDFDEVIRIDPRTESVFQSRASAYYELGQVSKALQDFLAELSARPFNDEVKIGVMVSKFEIGDLSGAMHDAESLRSSPNFGDEAARYRAAIYQEQGNIPKAMMEVDLAVSLEPKNPDSHLTKAALLLGFNEFEKAIEVCDEARKQGQGLPGYEPLVRGAALYRLGKLEEAHGQMKEVLQLSGKLRHDVEFSVAAHLILGNEGEARKAADELLKRSPEDRHSYYRAAQVAYWFSRKGDAKAQEQGLDQALVYLEEAKKRAFIAWALMPNDIFLKDILDHPRFKKMAGLP